MAFTVRGTIDPSFPASTHIKIPLNEVDVRQVYSLEDLKMGMNNGSTETDSVSDPNDND